MAGFNSGNYDCLRLYNNSIENFAGRAFLGISHIQLDGEPGHNVPEVASTLALLSGAVFGLCGIARRQRK